MDTAPIIGINCDIFRDATSAIAGVRSLYYEAVVRAGGLPVLLPPLPDAAALEPLLTRLDGMLMIGGDDISPARLGTQPHPASTFMSPEREQSDFWLVERLLRSTLPTLGICLACQELNVARGGTIWQDLADEHPTAVTHRAGTTPPYPEHAVRVEEGSQLAQMLGCERVAGLVRVNSVHHQGIRTVGEGLRAVAWAQDDLVEGLEVPEHPFFVAVQWHPERMPEDPLQRRLFAALIDAARERAGGR